MPAMDLAEAVAGTCRITWVIGWSAQEVTFPRAGLRRLGDVIDLSDKGEDALMGALSQIRPSGVAVFNDTPLELAAKTAEYFGLPFHSRETALALSDKLSQRRLLRAAGLPGPEFMALRPGEVADGVELDGGVTFPAVLKPRRGAGSWNTFLLHDEPELRRTLSALEDDDYLLEEYIEDANPSASRLGANVVSVETVFQQGRPFNLVVTGRFHHAPPFRETGSFMPADLSEEDAAAAKDVAVAACKALGIDYGVVHTEVKFSRSGPRVVEVNGRVGGWVPALLKFIGGPPLQTWAFRTALSLPVGPLVPLAGCPVSFFRWPQAPPGARRLVSASGLDRAATLPGVTYVRLDRQPGEPLDFRDGGTLGRLATIAGTAADHEALRSLVEELDTTVQFDFD